MFKLRRILVPINDFRRRSHPAALKAAQLAKHSGASIELFHAYDELVDVYALPDALETSAFERNQHGKSLAKLERLATRLRRLGVRVSTAVESDYPAHDAIIRRAARIKADLIAVDAHGHHRAPALLRVTDWELLRHSPLPVLLVKNKRAYRRPAILAAVDPQHSFSKPTGLDASILEAGAGLESMLSGRLHALHSFVPIPATAVSAETFSLELASTLQKLATRQARAGMERLLKNTKIPPARRHLVPHHPQDAIPEVAREIGAAIVVMGAVSRSGLKRIFVGNTAERVLDELGCDVLVVKPKVFESRVPKQTRGFHWRLLSAVASM
jgi:universal stress protein E